MTTGPQFPLTSGSRVCQGLGRGPGAAPPERLSHRTSQAVESIQAEDESAKLCKRRIEHLKEHSSDQPAAAGLWKRKRMDRMMVEHLLRCGYYNTAVKLARQSGIEVGGARRGLAGSGQRGRAWRGVPGLHARVLMSRVCKGLPHPHLNCGRVPWAAGRQRKGTVPSPCQVSARLSAPSLAFGSMWLGASVPGRPEGSVHRGGWGQRLELPRVWRPCSGLSPLRGGRYLRSPHFLVWLGHSLLCLVLGTQRARPSAPSS